MKDLYKNEYSNVRLCSDLIENGVIIPFGQIAKAAVQSWYMKHHEFTAWTDSVRAIEFFDLLRQRYPAIYNRILREAYGE